MKLRTLAVVLLGVSVVVAIPATTGFSTVSADRSLEIQVVDDSVAYLGVEEKSPALGNGTYEDETLLVLTNTFSSDISEISVSVSETDPSSPPTVASPSVATETVDVGSEQSVVGTIDCVYHGSSAPNGTVEVHVTAESSGTSVELSRDIFIDCGG